MSTFSNFRGLVRPGTNLLFLMIDHNIVWLDIPVHNALAVTEIQRLQKLINVETDIIIGKARVQGAEVCVIHVFENQTWSLALAITDDIEQGHYIRTPRQVLKNLDLTLDLLLLDGFKDLDDTFLVVDNVDTFKHFRVFPAACKGRQLACQVSSARLWEYRRL